MLHKEAIKLNSRLLSEYKLGRCADNLTKKLYESIFSFNLMF